MKIHQAVFEIPCSQYFLQFKKKTYQINNFEFRKKTKNILELLFLHILHVNFQKASFNSNRDIRQIVAVFGKGTQNNTPPAVFQKRAGGKQERINTLDTDTDMKLNNTFQL